MATIRYIPSSYWENFMHLAWIYATLSFIEDTHHHWPGACQWRHVRITFHSSNLLYLPELLAHLSRRLTRWSYRIGLEPASVCPLTISNMNISKTRKPFAIKFYLKHHWGGGKPTLGFGPDRIRTLVSMATDSSHRVIMGKTASPRFLGCFWSDPFHTCR